MLWDLMPEEDAAIIAGYYNGQPIVWNTPRPPLVRHLQDVISGSGGYGYVESDPPLAWPAEVATVYRDDPNAEPAASCADCGYPYPLSRDTTAFLYSPPTWARAYFTVCVLCGGKVAYGGWQRAHPKDMS